MALGDYPLSLGLNIVLIGTAGSFALVRHARGLLSRRGVGARRGSAVVVVWLALSLLVGGQASFYLRPFFGIAVVDPAPPLFEGSNPDFRRAHNFFEVVWMSRGTCTRPRAPEPIDKSLNPDRMME